MHVSETKLPWICKVVGVERINSPELSELRILTLPDCDNYRAQENKITDNSYSPASYWAMQGVEIHRLGLSRKLWNPFRNSHGLYAGLDLFRALKVLLVQRNYDYIMCYFESPAYFISIFKKFGLLRKPRLVVNEINYGSEWNLRERVVKTVLRNADVISVITDHLAEKLLDDANFRSKVYRSGFYIAEEAFEVLETPSNSHYFLAIGDDYSRDYITLVDAIKSIHPDIKFKIKTKKKLPFETLPGNIELIQEHFTREQLISLYRNALAVIIPLRYVSTPGGITSVLEAFSLGKCVLISDTPALKEFLDGQHCIKFEIGNSSQLAEKINYLWENRHICLLTGKSAREYFDGNCKKILYFKSYSNFLKKIIDKT